MPLAPYITLAELQAHLSEPSPLDPARQADMEGAILTASGLIEAHCSRDFAPGQRTETLLGNGSFVMPKAKPVAVVTTFIVDGVPRDPKIQLKGAVVSRRDNGAVDGDVTITYSVSEAVPEPVKLATKLTAQAILDAPAFDQNGSGYQAGGVYSTSMHQFGVGAIPPGAQTILSPFKRPFVA